MYLYYTQACKCNEPIIQELVRLKVSYVALDIDQDAAAWKRLYDLTHDLEVPTLELDDGRIFARPSIQTLRELFAPEATREDAQKREQEQLLAQSHGRLLGLANWGRYLNLVAIGCGLFWLGGVNPLGLALSQSIGWMIGVSVLLLVVTLADKFGLLKGLGQGLKTSLYYALFFFMAYLMGLSFVVSQGQIQQQYPAFSPVSVVTWLFVLGMGVWAGSVLLQLFKRLWIERQKLMQRVQALLGVLSLLGFGLSFYWVWKNQGLPPPIEFTWFMLGVLSLTLLVNLAFAVACMHTKSAIDKAGPVLYPAFAMLTLLVTILVSAR